MRLDKENARPAERELKNLAQWSQQMKQKTPFEMLFKQQAFTQQMLLQQQTEFQAKIMRLMGNN